MIFDKIGIMNKEKRFFERLEESLVESNYGDVFDKSSNLIKKTKLSESLGIMVGSEEEEYLIISMAWNINRKAKIPMDKDLDMDFFSKTPMMGFLENCNGITKWVAKQFNNELKRRDRVTIMFLNKKENILNESLSIKEISNVLDRATNLLSLIYLEAPNGILPENIFENSLPDIKKFRDEISEIKDINNRTNLN